MTVAVLPSSSTSLPRRSHGFESRSSLLERVVSLNPSLDRRSSTFRAAALLLAARAVGQNIDRLARFTGFPREFVARCARRLVDNGVWKSGEESCAWAEEGAGSAAFWADVGVAEGKLCRRVDEQGGFQWAPSGSWHKSYDFVDKNPGGLCNRYRSPSPGGPPMESPREEWAEKPARPTVRAFAEHVHVPRSEARVSPRAGQPLSPCLLSPSMPSVLPGGPELFPDATWLG